MSKHIGVNTRRLAQNPNEKSFADAWQEEAPNTLPWILNPTGEEREDYTDRDAVVAATIIQWLGSPVGNCFYETVQRKIRKDRP